MIKGDFSRLLTVYCAIFPDLHAGRSCFNCEHRDAFDVPNFPRLAGAHQQSVRIRAVFNSDFRAVEYDLISVSSGRSRHTGWIVTTIRLGQCRSDLQLAANNASEQCFFLLTGGQVRNERSTQYCGGRIGFDKIGFTKLLHDHHQVDGRPSEPAIFLGEWHRKPPQLRKQLPVVRAITCFRADYFIARVEVIALLNKFLH